MTKITAKVIADSISKDGVRLTTLVLCYPRIIHSELMTHRVFSRNASSSRAIPVTKMLRQIWNDLAAPIHWGVNKPGMQATETLKGFKLWLAKKLWVGAARTASVFAYTMHKIGLHKQVTNRVIEPGQYMHVILTSTEWDNFFELRADEDAQPEIHELALQIMEARLDSKPTKLEYGEWHLPFVGAVEFEDIRSYMHRNKMLVTQDAVMSLARKVSAARCCRVSYLKHDGKLPSVEEDLKLCDRLAASTPIHASPFEHQATPAPELRPQIYFNGDGDVEIKGYVPEGISHIDMNGRVWSGNLLGWIQSRKLIERSFQKGLFKI